MDAVSETGTSCTYEIDAELRIKAVDSAWAQFASANGAPELSVPPGPVGHPILSYISDSTTVQLYERLFERVRRTQRPLVFPFRCDGPAVRRFLEMEIGPGAESGLRLQTRVLRLEPRAPNVLLEADLPTSGELLPMCSWCKAVRTGSGWCEVEQAVVELRLFERELLPGITHGICPRCRRNLHTLVD
jgi:hypothetical protein